MLKHTTGLSLIILLTISLLLGGIPPSKAQKERIEIIKKTVLMSFGNKPISILILNYTFLSNSTVIVSNNFGDCLGFSLIAGGTWTQDETSVRYHYLGIGNLDTTFNFDMTKNQTSKISITGSTSVAMAFPVKFSTATLKNQTLWNGNIGFNYTDISGQCAFNARNSVLSISLSGAFNLDPSLVDSNMATATVTNQAPQQKTVHDSASNYFAYYANDTQIIAEYSTDGMSWENTRQIMVTLALTSAGNIFDINLYSESGSLVYIAIAYVVANTTSGRNVLYYRSDIFTKATSTWTLGTVYTILNYSLVTEHRLANPVMSRYGNEVFVAFSKSAQAGLKMLVWSTYKSTDGGASWASASIDKTWMLAGSAYDCWGGLTLMNSVNADRYMIYESATYTWKGRYYNSSTSVWAAEETPISIVPYHYTFGLNAYNNTVYASFATYIPFAIFPQFVVRNTTGSWLTPETFTAYQSRSGIVVLSVNASSGDAYAIWRNGNGSATQLLSQKRTFAGAWDSNVTQWFSDSNSYEAGFASMRNTYLDVIPFMFPSAPVGNWTLQYALLNFTAPAAGLAWFNASTFNLILNTRQWLNGSYLNVILNARAWLNASYLNLLLNTRAWLNASSLALLLNTRGWMNGSSLAFLLNTRSWLEAATLNFQLDTKGWYDAATFAFELASSQAYLIMPILFLALLIFGVLTIAIGYKRKGS